DFFLYSKKLHNFHGGFTHYRYYRAFYLLLENSRAKLGPVDLFIMSLKTRKLEKITKINEQLDGRGLYERRVGKIFIARP
ncbi:hypothetical protein NF430_08730, partial [Streptococcus suis]|uniref:hypothetical protein n=1 Tax=Streptococcus suis TaxID=1307 RepID=UPI0021181BE2